MIKKVRNRIYFDNASTTPLDKRVLRHIKPFLTKWYGNPSSVHLNGRIARKAINKAREQCAFALGCEIDEIFFTSGASEGNSWVAKNFGLQLSGFEHDSLTMSAKIIEYNNKFTFTMVDSETGHLHYSDLYYNCHVDLTQAIGKLPIYIKEKLNSDVYKYGTATLSAHKIGGLKGVGLLYIRKDLQLNIKPLIYGHQENSLRGGTENVIGIVSLGWAMHYAQQDFFKNRKKIDKIRKYIISYIYENNYSFEKMKDSLYIINITFKYLDAQTAVTIFDRLGIAISAGSACNSGTDKPSVILLNSGYTSDEALRTIRVSLGKQNTLREAKKFVKVLKHIIDNYDVE